MDDWTVDSVRPARARSASSDTMWSRSTDPEIPIPRIYVALAHAVGPLSDAGVPIDQIAGHTTTRMIETICRDRVTPTVSAALSPIPRPFALG